MIWRTFAFPFLFLCLQLYSKHLIELKPQYCGSPEETFLVGWLVGFLLLFFCLFYAMQYYFFRSCNSIIYCIWAFLLSSFILLPITLLNFMEPFITSKDISVTRTISQFLISVSFLASLSLSHFDNGFFSLLCRNKNM